MVADQIRALLTKVAGAGEYVVERPKQAEHGDYATNAALILAKQQEESQREVAEKLASKLKEDKLFESVEVAGPGFINFRVNLSVWQDQLADILKQQSKFGTFPKTGTSIELEYISGNPTGPLTLGNGRGGFGGDVLSRVLKRAGHEVNREYYVNDAGNQVESLGKTLTGEEVIYKGDYIKDLMKEVNTSASAREVGEAAAKVQLGYIQKTASRMGVEFDVWFSERGELHDTKEIEQVLSELEAAGATYEKDGAVWLKTSPHGDDKDRVIRKADGELTYLAADLAHYRRKFLVRRFDQAILIVGADHHGYVNRMQAGVELLRKIEHFNGQSTILVTQFVRLVEGGKEVKMSKRAGTFVALDDLLDQIPVDVARLFFVMQSFDTHMDFNLDLAKEQSQKNPVYYLKYAHARISSILKKAGKIGDGDLSPLKEPAELNLIRELSEFPGVIAETATDYQVQRIPHYALGLADIFHKFYEQCQVISDDAKLTAARLKLVQGTKIVLQNIGDTLGIEMPESM